MKRIFLICCMMSSILFAAAGYNFSFEENQDGSYQLGLQVLTYQVSNKLIDGQLYSTIQFGSSVFTQEKGFAQLPIVSASLRLPALRQMDFEIISSNYEEVDLDYPLLPSRGTIFRNQDPALIPYQIDPASLIDDWYPGILSRNERPFIIRDQRGNRVDFYPFQYNPVQQKLRIYTQLVIRQKPGTSAAINPLQHTPGKPLREMEALYPAIFMNPEVRDDLNVAELGDLLVLTTARDEVAIQDYINWKREKGFNVKEMVVARGLLVKSLIQQEYDANPNLLYVLLVGDWEDIKSELGTSSNLPMDADMGCVSGTDSYPDIAIGRLSAQSAADVTLQVNKIIQYEKNPPSTDSWLSRATGIASAEGPGDDNEKDFEHEDVIWQDKLHTFSYDQYNAIYDPGASSTQVSTAVNSGTGIINYTGHGSSTSWGTTGFSNSDVQNLNNGNLLPSIFSVACNNGEFNRSSDCFAEAWLKKENGGAVMMLASTISQPWDPPMRGQDYFMDMLCGGYDYDAHPGQNGINSNEQRTFSGTVVVNGFNLMLNESSTVDDINTVQTWTIFGDPAMQLRTKSPAALSLSNEVVRTGITFTSTVTSAGIGVPNAMVTLSQNGLYFSGVSDQNGQVSIEQNLDPGPALLVATAFNCETIYQQITVSSADGPWVSVDSTEIDDSLLGNGNQLADFDESFSINVWAKNIGNQDAQAVSAVLQESDPFISVSDSNHNYGTISSGQTVAGQNAFALITTADAPDQHSASCQVRFTDQMSNSWTSNINVLLNAPSLQNGSCTVDDAALGNNDQSLDIGETADLLLPTFNQGHAPASDVQVGLSSNSPFLNIQTAAYHLGALAAGDSLTARFNVSASPETPAGTEVFLFYHATFAAYSCDDTLTLRIGDIPSILMADGNEYIGDVLFYDTGGADGNYDVSQKLTLTFYPTNRSVIKADFQSFLLSDLDAMHIYDGVNTDAPEISGSPFTTTNSPGEVVATNGSGALTFYFTSNIVYTEAGWKAHVYSTVIADLDKEFNPEKHSFALAANYPNPFNPRTRIDYQIPERSRVQLTVFNILGQGVRTLVDKSMAAGNYTAYFDASGFSSGIYYYKLVVGNEALVRKMILLK